MNSCRSYDRVETISSFPETSKGEQNVLQGGFYESHMTPTPLYVLPSALTLSPVIKTRHMKRFCRWVVVCFMCVHETSYVYSHVCSCSKAPCLDDNQSTSFISVIWGPYHRNYPSSPDKTCYRDFADQSLPKNLVVEFCPKSLTFYALFTSLCYTVLHAV